MIKKTLAVIAVLFLASGCSTTSSTKTGNTNLVTIASKHIGLHEHKHNKQLKQIVGVNPARIPWCGYYAAYVVKKAGLTPPKGYPRARNWLNYGKKVNKKDARSGDIIVRGNHVAIITKIVGNKVHAVSGNTSNKVGATVYTMSSIDGVRR